MDTKELILYETPSIAEYISVGWIQDIIIWYIAKKVKRKIKRFNKRKARQEYIEIFKNRKQKFNQVAL